MSLWRSVARVALATTAYFAVHSLLASRKVKAKVEETLGTRVRNGLYRPLYNAQAIGGFVALAIYIRRQPNEILYEIEGSPALALRAVQVLLTAEAAYMAHQVGIIRFSGLPGLAALLVGKPDVPREPEGQGPSLNQDGSLRVTAGFRHVRHPLNSVIVALFALSPRMTVNWATVCALTLVYCYAGSFHEEIRLRQRYGKRYQAYQSSGVPFFLPSPFACPVLPRRFRDE